MGWFFESENDKREKMIVSYSGTICSHMKNVTSRIERDGGITHGNSSFILGEMQSIVSLKDRMEAEINQLPQSRINRLYLTWVDGRSIPFHLWAGSYQMGALQLQRMIDDFSKYNG